eukprot:5670857-Prymnesium_polylepis.3
MSVWFSSPSARFRSVYRTVVPCVVSGYGTLVCEVRSVHPKNSESIDPVGGTVRARAPGGALERPGVVMRLRTVTLLH